MWCLTRATNAVVTWTTEYNGLAVTALRRSGRDIDDAALAHIWPTHHENIHFYGTHSVDVAGELAKLGSDGYRPLKLSAEQQGSSKKRVTRPKRAWSSWSGNVPACGEYRMIRRAGFMRGACPG